MFTIPKKYKAEFNELTIKHVKAGQGIGPVARDLGLVEQTLRNWVKAYKQGKLIPPDGKAVTPLRLRAPLPLTTHLTKTRRLVNPWRDRVSARIPLLPHAPAMLQHLSSLNGHDIVVAVPSGLDEQDHTPPLPLRQPGNGPAGRGSPRSRGPRPSARASSCRAAFRGAGCR